MQEWHAEHRAGILECGASPSSLCPTLYLWYRGEQEEGEVRRRGALGAHVDDDLMHFDAETRSGYVDMLRQRFPYGKWHQDDFTHCGRDISSTEAGVTVTQKQYALGLKKIFLSRQRRAQAEKEVMYFKEIRSELAAKRGGSGKKRRKARKK